MTPDQTLRIQPSITHAPHSDAASAPPPPSGSLPARQAADGPRSGFVYDGRLGQLYGIFLMNLLWTILTFSIFRFWGKTRMRRYLWSHTSLNGDRFEYTGTGGELFIGFLIVMAAYVIASIGIQILGIFTDPESPVLAILQMGLLLVILYLTFVAQYAAQRYRLTRTVWRGINGGMTGSAWSWGFKGFFFTFLSLISFTLAWPWAQMRLVDDRINNSYFGDAKASIQTSSKPLYLAYILGFISSVIGIGILVTVVSTAILGASFIEIFNNPEYQGDRENLGWRIAITFFIIYFGIILISLTAFSFYQVAMAREIAAKLSLSNLRFATSITVGRLLNRYIWNVVIVVITIGLGLPIAIHRTMQFLADNIEVIGEIEGSDITHANLPRPKAGEGLLEAFDPGIL